MSKMLLRTTREVLLITSYWESFVPANLLPNAHANFSRPYVGEMQELKDSMFASSSMQLANKYKAAPVEALDYYAKAVSGLRRQLDEGSLMGTEDCLLLTMILSHCFEVSGYCDFTKKLLTESSRQIWRYDADYSTPVAFQHLLGTMQLLKLRCQMPLADDGHHDLYVLIAESVLFHISTLLVSSPSFAALDIDSDLWEWIEVILQKPSYEPPAVNHPVLGTPRQLNKLVFEISRLSVHVPLPLEMVPELEILSVEFVKVGI
jgi:hypothetical protein